MCRRFNHTRIAGFAAEELQADEIRTFAGNKKTPSWVFVTIEVWSRLWPSTVTGRRSYRNTHALFHDLSRRMNFERLPLIVTDGFEFYQKVIRRFFGVWSKYSNAQRVSSLHLSKGRLNPSCA